MIGRTVRELNFTSIDFETTGLHPEKGDRVIEIGAIKVVEGYIVKEYSTLVACDKAIPRVVQELTGIRPEMLAVARAQSLAFEELQDFFQFDILVAHNARFDISFLEMELSRIGRYIYNPVFCTLRFSRDNCRGVSSFSLASLYQHLLPKEAGKETIHRASSDARMAAEVCIELHRRIWEGLDGDLLKC